MRHNFLTGSDSDDSDAEFNVASYTIGGRTDQTASMRAGFVPPRVCNSKQRPDYTRNIIMRFPVELLSLIFEYCLPLVSFVEVRVDSAPLLFCQVCSHWRWAAISAPKLWLSLSIGNLDSSPPSLPLVKLWLERSRGGLSLYLGNNSSSNYLGLFLSMMKYWRKVSFFLNDDLAKLFIATYDGAPLLKEIKIHAMDCSDDIAINLSKSLNTSSLTQLRKLMWFSERFPSTMDFTWSNLTSIYLSSKIDANRGIDILSACTSAVDFTLDLMEPIADGSSPKILVHPVELPSLVSLNITSTGCDIMAILDNFTLPALRSLILDITHPGHPRDIQSFEKFQARSQCQLHTFVLDDQAVEEDDFLYCLRLPCFETLRTLIVDITAATDRTLNFLVTPVPGDILRCGFVLPDLTRLELIHCRHTDIPTDRRFEKMVTERSLSGDPTLVLKVFNCRDNGPEESELLELMGEILTNLKVLSRSSISEYLEHATEQRYEISDDSELMEL